MSPTPKPIRLTAYRPAATAALCLAIGIGIHQAVPTHPGVYLVLLAALVLLTALLRRKPLPASASLGAAIMLAGCIAGQLDTLFFAPNEVGLFSSADEKLATIRGVIEQTPVIVEAPPRGRALPDKQTLSVRATSVLTTHGWAAVTGRLPVYVCPPAAHLEAGEQVEMLGRLGRLAPAMNPGQFDDAIEQRRDRILAEFRVTRPYDIHVLSHASQWQTILTTVGDRARHWLDAGASPSSADRSLLRALVFGDREPVLRPVADNFNLSGTAHLLASNGARLFALAGLLYTLLRLLRIAPSRAVAIVMIIAIAFGLLLSPTAQSLRPLIVFAVAGTALLLRRRTDAIQLLAIAAVALLAVHPLDLFRPGFQLGFVIVTAMIVLTPPVMHWLERFEDVDQRVAEMAQRPSRSRRFKRWLRIYLIRGIVAATIAWLAALPLVALHFEQFNLWTVPFSLLLAPITAATMIAGFFKLLFTAMLPQFAGIWASIALVPSHALAASVAALNRIPGADIAVPSPAVWRVFFFYTALVMPLFAWRRRAMRWSARCAPVAGCLLIIVAPITVGAGPLVSIGRLRITLISLGAGQCAVVEPPGAPAFLIDAGSSTLADPLRTCIGPYLRHEGISSLDSIWLSHGDFDHIGAVAGLLPRCGHPQVITSPFFRRHASESAPCASLLNTLDESGQTPKLHVAGDRVDVGQRAQLVVLWPPPECEMNSNNAGMVLQISYAGRTVLLPADIQEPAERELLRHPELLKADILVAPHHGSAELTTSRFIDAVSPHAIVSSNAARLSAKQRLFNRETTSIPLYRTSESGAVTIDIESDGRITITPFRVGGPPTLTWTH
jgi:competence protein ComEC